MACQYLKTFRRCSQSGPVQILRVHGPVPRPSGVWVSLGGILVVLVVKVVVLFCDSVEICAGIIWFALHGFSLIWWWY